MKKSFKKFNFQKGQVIPLVALIMLAVIAMVMLLIDGGTLLSYRRTAQAAADAGAMAGAQHICWQLPGSAPDVIQAYVENNGAVLAEAPEIVGYQVTVTTTVEGDSFFARVFGVDRLSANAEAAAGCNGVKGKGVIPLGWRCVPNDEVDPAWNPRLGCQQQVVVWDAIRDFVNDPTVQTAKIPDSDGDTYTRYNGFSLVDDPNKDVPIPPGELYIMFDGEKLCFEDQYEDCYYNNGGTPDNPDDDVYCCERSGVETCGVENLDGDWQCDLDGDGKKDLQQGGERGGLYLQSTDNAVTKWITSDTQPPITLRPHTWLTATSGIGAIVNKMDSEGWSGEVVLVPVYNYLCEDDPSENSYCLTEAHSEEYTGENWADYDPDVYPPLFEMKSGGSMWFHIVAFQPFFITCADKQGECPGYRYAQSIINPNVDPNIKLGDTISVVEGFFLSNYDEVSVDGNVICDALQLDNCGITLRENGEN